MFESNSMSMFNKTNNKQAVDTILESVEEDFGSQGISLNTVHGFTEVLSEDALFESYKQGITQDMSAELAETVGGLLENTRQQILSESTTAGIQPITSLTGPVLRKMFPKVGLVNAIPTEVAKQPRFSLSYLMPYILGDDGEQYPLPEAMFQPENGMVKRRQLSTEPIQLPADEHDLFTPVGASRATGDAVDSDFRITKAFMQVETEEGEVEDVEVTINAQVGVDGNLFARVTGEASDGNEMSDTLTGGIDLKRGILDVTCIKGLIQAVEVEGFLTSENNAKTTSVSFEIAKIDVEIPTAEHIDTLLPIEFLEDARALYGIDGTTESVNLMSRVIAQKTDLDAIQFIDESIERISQPDGKYIRQFDLHPPASFKGRPKEWLEELKTVIDFIATDMKFDSRMDEGYFTIIGNPLDVRLLPNVDWVFTEQSSSTQEVAGVNVNYQLGAVSGENRYKIVSSPNVPKGELRMIFIPTTPANKTYKFYPYSYHVVKDNSYRSPKMPPVPSIMMTKRQRFVEVTPIAGKIVISNNDGVLPR